MKEMIFFDERTWKTLDPRMIRAAREEEVSFMKGISLYEEVNEDEAWSVTGRAPITTKWVDVNKGTDTNPDVRCRLVARDFKPKGGKSTWDVFAAMPPLEAKKILLRYAALKKFAPRKPGIGKEMKLLFVDAKNAHLNGVVEEGHHIYVSLPPEAKSNGKCGKLKRWLYGMRGAGNAWERDYSRRFQDAGFVKGTSAPTVF